MVEATIQGVHRGTIYSDVNFHLEGETVATADEPEPTAERIETPIYNLVIEHPEGTLLWDTGSHPEAGEGHWPTATYQAFEQPDAAEHTLEDALADAGYELADIDAVCCSHLHVDHAGGLHNFAGTDTPIFVHAEELKHAYYSVTTDEGDDAYVRDDFDRDLAWEIVHRDRRQLFDGLELLHLPGHTPGLLGVKIDLDDAGTVILAGDQAYTRANYEYGLPMGGYLLWSKRDWLESLRTLEDLEQRHDARIVCGHAAEDLEAMRTGL
jgi:glyoxylase-like metal-dependent hydrolase (beta-lactamase superfamily II)